jgi:hypothetical protein
MSCRLPVLLSRVGLPGVHQCTTKPLNVLDAVQFLVCCAHIMG